MERGTVLPSDVQYDIGNGGDGGCSAGAAGIAGAKANALLRPLRRACRGTRAPLPACRGVDLPDLDHEISPLRTAS